MTFEYVCFSITSQCNLECPYCYRVNSNSLNISNHSFKACIERLKELGCKVVNITGGEPLLHPDWKEFVDMARKYGINVILSTNTVLLDLDEPMLKLINVLTIPLDGYNQDVNSKTRGYLHYQCALNTIVKYNSGHYPFRLKINTVLTKYNYDSAFLLGNFVCKNTIWKMFICKRKGVYNHLPLDAFISEGEYLTKVNEIQAMPIEGTFMYEDCVNDAHGTNEYTIVDSNGNIYLSTADVDIYIGNLLVETKSNILNAVDSRGLMIKPYQSLNGLDELFL